MHVYRQSLKQKANPGRASGSSSCFRAECEVFCAPARAAMAQFCKGTSFVCLRTCESDTQTFWHSEPAKSRLESPVCEVTQCHCAIVVCLIIARSGVRRRFKFSYVTCFLQTWSKLVCLSKWRACRCRVSDFLMHRDEKLTLDFAIWTMNHKPYASKPEP